jgi:hypothetical protein
MHHARDRISKLGRHAHFRRCILRVHSTKSGVTEAEQIRIKAASTVSFCFSVLRSYLTRLDSLQTVPLSFLVAASGRPPGGETLACRPS